MKYPYKIGKITFPDDEGRHDDARFEWWYFSCHLKSDKKSFGLMFSFHKHLNLLYFIISDNNKKSVLGGVINRYKLEALPNKLDLKYGQNFWRQLDDKPFTYRMHVEEGELKIDLQAAAVKPPLALGKNGIVKMGKGGNSFWYAQTHLDVEGSLELNGEKFEVTGSGCIDQQWGNWRWFGFDGWRWFSVQLENNIELTIINIFEPFTNRLLVSDIYLVSDEAVKIFKKYKIKSLDEWRSPKSNERYSIGWKIEIPDIKSELLVKPYFQNQEIRKGLWEGACSVEGRLHGKKVAGSAYVELFHGTERSFYKKVYLYLLSCLKNMKESTLNL